MIPLFLPNKLQAFSTIILPGLCLFACTQQTSQQQALFKHHFITNDVSDEDRFRFGTPTLADLDNDGDLDICFKVWMSWDQNGNGGRAHAGYLENQTK